MEAGLGYRTPFPYKIIKLEEPDEEPETNIKDFAFKWIHPVRSGRAILKPKLKKWFIPSDTPPEEIFKIF